jgi:hypothetical protein
MLWTHWNKRLATKTKDFQEAVQSNKEYLLQRIGEIGGQAVGKGVGAISRKAVKHWLLQKYAIL